MMNMNRVLAEENIAQEPKLIELKAIVNELSDEGKTLLTQVQDKINDYSKLVVVTILFQIHNLLVIILETKSNNISQDTALALLQSAAAEAEDESEKINQQFLDKEITSIDTFLDQFIASRKKMHERKLKADKMVELMRNQSNRNSNFFNTPNSGGALPYPMSGGNVPYPIGPAGMPMPGMPHYRPPY